MEQSLQQWIELIGLVTQIFEFLNNFISNKKDYIFVRVTACFQIFLDY